MGTVIFLTICGVMIACVFVIFYFRATSGSRPKKNMDEQAN